MRPEPRDLPSPADLTVAVQTAKAQIEARLGPDLTPEQGWRRWPFHILLAVRCLQDCFPQARRSELMTWLGVEGDPENLRRATENAIELGRWTDVERDAVNLAIANVEMAHAA